MSKSVREQVEEAYRRDFCACKTIDEEKSVGVYCRIVLLNNRILFREAEETAAEVVRLRGLIESIANAIDVGLTMHKPDLLGGIEATRDSLRAALSPQPVQNQGVGQ